MEYSPSRFVDYAEALAFLGNSLLAPMSQTGNVGLDPAFWRAFPNFEDARTEAEIEECVVYAERAQERAEHGGNPVHDASVEYTLLFVGPPRPAVAPWETMYRSGSQGASAGFGQATIEMRRLLVELGLEVSNANNQYADHIGIELLCASVLCERAAASCVSADEMADSVERIVELVLNHPLGWIDELIAALNDHIPNGYIAHLVTLARAILATLPKLL